MARASQAMFINSADRRNTAMASPINTIPRPMPGLMIDLPSMVNISDSQFESAAPPPSVTLALSRMSFASCMKSSSLTIVEAT